MGGFLLLIVLFILLIITIVFLIIWAITKKKAYGKAILYFWGGIFTLYFAMYALHLINSKKVLEKQDFYGHYTIDRNYFSGKQADWQYDNFRFEIRENDSIYFYVTDGPDIMETYKGKISTLAPYKSARLVIKMEEPNHHILTTNPTIYRESWDFFMVFNSPKFSNMYFRKGKWTKID
ncbi:hypothetical protein EJ994_00160 [Maribacter sp. MJ134]|uniref:hypothetical protein n=1 Tax=Maribacter sp. MJ134 TaxID=2496865 RepID=UPI000F829691|nr:hypothetical protein [Maribacter sp. MJ134]AZQ57295.1 hypothetical protein EJ994_00160 [Maribacter sp. MJ134]